MRIRTRDSIFVGVAILLASIASGCSQLQRPVPTAAIAPIPRPVAPASSQTVKASYYDDEFRGHRTASGERYDPNQLTAASKKLPIGSLVHVTNPENGRSVVVRINDHGPYAPGRSLDLSKAAARRIGLTHKGVGRVKIARIQSRPRTETIAPPEEAKSAAPAAVPATVPVSEQTKSAEAATLPPRPSESSAAVQ
jgi:rare lipoprotein A